VRSLLLLLPSLAGGGAERASLTLANALVRDGWRVVVATVHGGGPLGAMLDPQVQHLDLGHRRVASALLSVPALVRERRPEVVLSTPAHLNLAVLLTRAFYPRGTCVFVREANTPSKTLPTQPLPSLFAALSRRLYRRADAVLCPARLVAHELTTLLRVPARQVHVLPNPVDWEALERARSTPLRREGEGVRLVAAGRLTRQKNFSALLDGMARLPASTTLELFGEGPLEAALRAQTEALGLTRRVRIHGFSDQLWRWLAGADALALPSLWEGMPNVVLEALGCGARVIAMRSAGGVGELTPANPEALMLADDAVDFIRRLDELRPMWSGPGRASHLDPSHRRETVARQFSGLYESVREKAA
jgi:glycosyltransferase involved in cell wall biosynthesis